MFNYARQDPIPPDQMHALRHLQRSNLQRLDMEESSGDGDNVCPLCAEEMDLTDKQLKPCQCGYEWTLQVET